MFLYVPRAQTFIAGYYRGPHYGSRVQEKKGTAKKKKKPGTRVRMVIEFYLVPAAMTKSRRDKHQDQTRQLTTNQVFTPVFHNDVH